MGRRRGRLAGAVPPKGLLTRASLGRSRFPTVELRQADLDAARVALRVAHARRVPMEHRAAAVRLARAVDVEPSTFLERLEDALGCGAG